MSAKKVSIITPNYNRAHIITETAESIFNQTYSNWEWLIIDDGSNDGSLELLDTYSQKDARVKLYVRDRKPKGACTCRNIGVEKSTGDYILFLDSDDLLSRNCLNNRLLLMNRKEYINYDCLIFPSLLFKKKPYDLRVLWNKDKRSDDINRMLSGDAICQTSGPLWRKKSIENLGLWNENLKIWQDIELHIRAFLYPVKYKKFLNLEPDVFLRKSDDSLSRGDYYSLPKMNSRLKVFRYALSEIEKKGLLNKHKYGLRVMGTDIVISLVNSNLYKEAKLLIKDLGESEVFSKEELSRFKIYSKAHKLKLYKIPAAFKIIKDNALALGINNDVTLNKVKYSPPVK